MVKAPRRANRSARPVDKRTPEFKPIGWTNYKKPRQYISFLQAELFRLGLEQYDKRLVPLHSRPLQEIFEWQDEFPNAAYANLHDWRTYDLQRLIERNNKSTVRGSQPKPRIEIVPELTTKHNLSVKWYPAGYFEATPDWSTGTSGFTLNEIATLKFEEPPDFTYFTKESFGWGARPANELLFLRGIGELHIDESSFNGAPYGFSNLEELLICTVRAIFNQLVEWCRLTTDVTVRTDFVFDTYSEEIEDPIIPGQARTRVKSWKIAETVVSSGA